MIILVSGSRNFPNRDLVVRRIRSRIEPGDTLIHGGARGVDTWCAIQARERGAHVHEMPANWEAEGKKAGILRNIRMLDVAETRGGNDIHGLSVYIFWDGESRGAKHMIDLCLKRKVPFQVYFP